MAEQVESAAQKPRIPSEEQFKKLLKKLSVSEAKLNDAKGEMGGTVDAAITAHNVHKDALRVIRKYLKKDPTSAAEFFLHLDAYWEYAGLALPEEDLLETPGQRAARAEPLGKPTHVIQGGREVPLKETA